MPRYKQPALVLLGLFITRLEKVLAHREESKSHRAYYELVSLCDLLTDFATSLKPAMRLRLGERLAIMQSRHLNVPQEVQKVTMHCLSNSQSARTAETPPITTAPSQTRQTAGAARRPTTDLSAARSA
jgi:hypothetical protein